MNIAVTGINFIRQAEVAARLRQILPAEAVLHAEEDTRSYECDGLSAYRQLPMVVALPSNEEEVRQVLAACHELKAPVVARGAGTGDRKSTRLNSSHMSISYAVFCLKKKKNKTLIAFK